jgi:hypothetical protein
MPVLLAQLFKQAKFLLYQSQLKLGSDQASKASPFTKKIEVVFHLQIN